jgi:calcineurin-like phosphoesterase family protein
MKTWFTADNHFNHSNIIKHCFRPFDNCVHMDETMVKQWNETVGKEDIVYHLGDLAFYRGYPTIKVLSRLNGKIRLIKGNHDSEKMTNKLIELSIIESVELMKEYMCQETGLKMILCHYPLESFRKGWVNIHGHCHGNLNKKKDRIDIGVDAATEYLDELGFEIRWAPVSAKQIQDFINWSNSQIR